MLLPLYFESMSGILLEEAGLRYGSGEKERAHQASAILRKVKVR
jgi:hypothetical protein